MLNGNITGIDPFVPWSTFRCATLNIPRGLFYGGIFYTTESYTPPCHISFISGQNEQEDESYLSTWGIADATGKELAQMTFSASQPEIGHILTNEGEYGGCLKARIYNYNNTSASVWSAADNDVVAGSDLEVFLRSIYGEHTLDDDSLILDVCTCCSVPTASGDRFNLKSVRLPVDCVLEQDDNGMYYVAKDPELVTSTGGLTGLAIAPVSGGTIVSGSIVTISGAHLTLTPWTVSGGIVKGSGATISYTSGVGGAEDVGIDVVDGGIVIGTHGQLSQVL